MDRRHRTARTWIGVALLLALACDGGPDQPTANVLAQQADGSFDSLGIAPATRLTGFARGAAGDMDGDGQSDLVLVGKRIELRQGIESAQKLVPTSIDRTARTVLLADVRGDDRDEVLILADPNELLVLSSAAADLELEDDAPSADGGCALWATDVDADGDTDVLVAGPKGLEVHFNDAGLGGSVHQVNKGTFCDGPGRHLAVGDLNGDGSPDVAMLRERDSLVRVVWNDGLGGFGSQEDHEIPDTPTTLAITDITEDGRPDVVVATADDVQVVAQGTDALLDAVVVTDAHGVLRIQDLDGDGAPELLGIDELTDEVMLWRRAGGDWSEERTFVELPPTLTDLVLTDADRNGLVDAIVVGHGRRGCGE